MAGTARLGGLRTLATNLGTLSRAALSSFMGSSYNGKRNLYEVFGYNQNPTFYHYLHKYNRQDVAKRIVSAAPSATWSGHTKLNSKAKRFTKAWDELVRKHDIWARLQQADILAGIGHFGIIFLGFDDNIDVSQPVGRATQLSYMHAFTEGSVRVAEVDTDVTSPRFGMPTRYVISVAQAESVASPSATTGAPSFNTPTTIGRNAIKPKEVTVHYSRILHIAEEPIDIAWWGTPRLRCCFNLLDDLLKVAGGSAESYWISANRGMQIDVDKEMDLSAEDAAALEDEIEQYQHELRRAIRTRGVEITPLVGEFYDPRGTFEVILALIAAATEIPRRILIGSEAGQLASEQDRANWASRTNERRRDFAEPQILRPFIERLIDVQLLPKNDDWTVEWGDPFHMSPLEEDQSRAQKARALANTIKQWQGGTPVVSLSELRELLGFPGTPEGGFEELRHPLMPDPTDPNVNPNARPRDPNPNDSRGRGSNGGAGAAATAGNGTGGQDEEDDVDDPEERNRRNQEDMQDEGEGAGAR